MGKLHVCMDSRLSWKGDTKFSDRLCHGIDPQSGHWIDGGICHCQTALEIRETDDDILFDRYDGADSLRTDSTVQDIFEYWIV